jgi:hypothetical protein
MARRLLLLCILALPGSFVVLAIVCMHPGMRIKLVAFTRTDLRWFRCCLMARVLLTAVRQNRIEQSMPTLPYAFRPSDAGTRSGSEKNEQRWSI